MSLIDADARQQIMSAARPRRALPLFPDASTRQAPALGEAREKDRAFAPILAVWEVTLRCDLACRHCGSRAGAARPDELSTAECLDLIDQLAALGTREVALIGGEAYLRDDWLELIRAIKAKGMNPTMTTGGRGLTAERAHAAKAAGLYSVSVSIDGLEGTHDRLRGVRGSHAAALEAMRNLTDAKIPFGANTQINRLSADELPEVLETIARAGAKSWQLQLTVAMGRAVDEPDMLLQPYDLVAIYPVVEKLFVRARELGVNPVAGNNLGYFGPHERTLRGRRPAGHSAGCGAGRATMGIEADGTIKGCPSLATSRWSGGNVRTMPLKEIWQRAEAMRYTRDRTEKDLWGYCADCYYADVCRAGCTWTGDVLFRRPGNNPYCHHRALEMKAQGLRERVVRVKEAPGEPFDDGEFELISEPWVDHDSMDARVEDVR
jgi:radical SAM protein with 4Fe4S-binding SPASM domain